MKIGVLGGTFDPIHYAHLVLAECVREDLYLDKIIFVPAHQPPHKIKNVFSTSLQRLAMIKLAIAENPYFEASDVEIKRGGISYTIDTVKALRRQYALEPKELSLIIGSDSLEQIPTWREPEQLFRECKIVVVIRPGYLLESVKYKNNYTLVNIPLIDISSSNIRERVKKGKSLRYFTAPAVAQFIAEQNLYAS